MSAGRLLALRLQVPPSLFQRLPRHEDLRWPNAGAHLLLEAAATQERRLEAVRCKPWFGLVAPRVPACPAPAGPVAPDSAGPPVATPAPDPAPLQTRDRATRPPAHPAGAPWVGARGPPASARPPPRGARAPIDTRHRRLFGGFPLEDVEPFQGSPLRGTRGTNRRTSACRFWIALESPRPG